MIEEPHSVTMCSIHRESIFLIKCRIGYVGWYRLVLTSKDRRTSLSTAYILYSSMRVNN
jgi:hypothetical protein